VSALVTRIKDEQGRLDILVNDIWGATKMEWNKSVWESSLDYGLRTLRLAVDTHAITSHFAIPLLIQTPGGLVVEVTDGTAEYNETNYRVSFFYDQGGEHPNGVRAGARAAASPGDGRVTHSGLAAIRGHARRLRRHRIELA
jgi:NAD(P)-dependent dehydrogenase (short-subunit alcohol dehydrogenase family)